MTEAEAPAFPSLRLRLFLSSGAWLGPGKADLLEGIARTGSISAAGRRMGMSYKRAWGLADGLNAMFPTPLIVASRGGAEHGGAGLTELGQEVLGLYRAMQAKADQALAADMRKLGDLAGPGDIPEET